MHNCLLFDVGGTQIKAGLFSCTSNQPKEWLSAPSHAQGDAKEVFHNLARMAMELTESLRKQKQCLSAVGMAWPGDFDYDRGICLMRGVGKYDGIYGLDIRKELLSVINRLLPDKEVPWQVPFYYLHDVAAFALGEYQHLPAKTNRSMYLCVGTGAGSAFMEDGKLLTHGSGVPARGWIYDTPFREGILDDYLSVRGLESIAKTICGCPMDGLTLCELAQKGDTAALATFAAFGDVLYEAATPFLQAFAPDALVLGGQIMKSFVYFGERLTCFLKEKRIHLALSQDTSISVCQGLMSLLRQKGPEEWRR